jgi:hypothetical protein
VTCGARGNDEVREVKARLKPLLTGVYHVETARDDRRARQRSLLSVELRPDRDLKALHRIVGERSRGAIVEHER